jgi:hypothetical protein
MIPSIPLIIFSLGLLILSLIDLKYKEIPSIILSGFLLYSVSVFGIHYINLYFGILGAIISLIYFESDFIKGIGDIKVLSAVGLVFVTLESFIAFHLLIIIFTIGIAGYRNYFLKDYIKESFPYIPLIFFIFLCMLLLGFIIK